MAEGTVDKKGYLKKYLSGDDTKRKKKKKSVKGKRLKIVDDDIDVLKMRPLEADEIVELFGGEDAPQIAGIVDDREVRLKTTEDFRSSRRWRVIADENGFEDLKIEAVGNGGEKGGSDETSKNIEQSCNRNDDSSLTKCVSQKDSEKSPPRRSGVGDISLEGRPKEGSNSDADHAKKSHHRGETDASPPRKSRKGSESDATSPRKPRRGNESDASPPRRSKKNSSSNESPLRKSKKLTPSRNARKGYDSDISPPRKFGKGDDSDASPQRKSKRDFVETSRKQSRKENDHEMSLHRKPKQQSSDASPVRRSSKRPDFDVSSFRNSRKEHGSDVSPHRKSRKGHDSDVSPPRKFRKRHDSEISPPRKSRKGHDSDVSPPRKSRKGFNYNTSPPRKSQKEHHTNVFLPRKSKPDHDSRKDHNIHISPPRQLRKGNDSDVSPPRRSGGKSESPPVGRPKNQSASHSSLNRSSKSIRKERGSDSDPSPPRRHQRKELHHTKDCYSDRHSHDHHRSPGKEHERHHSHTRDPSSQKLPSKHSNNSPLQIVSRAEKSGAEENKHKRSERLEKHSENGERPQKMDKTLEGKRAGLQAARDLKEELSSFKRKEDEMFKKLGDSVSGKGAVAIVRDRKTGKIRDLEEEARQKEEKSKKTDELKAKYSKWSRGLKQVEEQQRNLEATLHEMSKPLARYADDEDLDKFYREQEREGDPMLEYIRKKKAVQKKDVGQSKPKYDGEYLPNRFHIPPGYRWDGVDRSNGYEVKWFEQLNARKAQEEEAYKWSTSDM